MPIKLRKFVAQVRDSESGDMIPAGLLSSDALGAIENAKSDAVAAVEGKQAVTEAAIELKGQRTIASIPNDYTELQNEVDDVKNALYSKTFSLPERYWQRNGLASASGDASSSTTRISTINYLDDEIGFVSASSGYDFAVFAWDNTDVYKGVWSGSAWVTSGITWHQNEISLKDLPGGYRYKILAKAHSGASTTITLAECTNILFHLREYTDATLTVSRSPADAKVTGDAVRELKKQIDNSGIIRNAVASDFIVGNLNYASGAIDKTLTGEVITGFIPVERFCSIYKNTQFRLKIAAYSENTESSFISGIRAVPNTVDGYAPYTQSDLLTDFPTAKYIVIGLSVYADGDYVDPITPAEVLSVNPQLKLYSFPEKDIITGFCGRNVYFPAWEKGRYNPETGEKVSSPSHIRTTDAFAYNDNIAILVDNYMPLNVRYRLTFFDSNNIHIATKGFMTRGCRIKDVAPEGTAYFGISLTTTSADADLLYNAVIMLTDWTNTLEPIDNEVRGLLMGQQMLATVWEDGGINSSEGENYASNTFIRTKEFLTYEDNMVIVLVNRIEKLRYRVMYYDENNTYLGFSGDQSNSFHKRGIKLKSFAPEGTVYFRIAVTTITSASVSTEMGEDVVITNGNYALLPLDEQVTEIFEELKEQGIDQLPDYYEGYLRAKAKEIITIQNNISVNSVQFFLISDYHTRTNEGHSKAMINRLSSETGITMLCYTGDGGGNLGSSDDKRLEALIKTAEVWDGLQKSAKEFYGTLGNHEWITASYFHRSAVTNVFLGRYKNTVFEMDPYYGSYCVDNKVNKVRYYFLQCTSAAVANGYVWMANDLLSLPEGYNVAVFAHHGAIPGEASRDEYDGVVLPDDGDSNVVARIVASLLHAYEAHEGVSFTVSGQSYSFDYSGRTGNDAVIGIFCGHYHHGTLFEKDDALNTYNIAVFRASTDSLQAASIAVDKTPWYWEDGIVGGTQIVREANTPDEQCFYAVQIDLDAKKVYITAVGGDHDWEFEY